MKKRGFGKSLIIIFSVILILLLIVAMFLYSALKVPDYGEKNKIILQNPIKGLTLEQAKINFNESFVEYLLYSIGANNLHNPPLSNNKPKIKITIENDIYSSVIEKGRIIVKKEDILNQDITLKTNKEEAIKIMENKNYIKQSFSSGKSEISLSADKATLFAKGYLNIYKELTGESITGGVIKIYTE